MAVTDILGPPKIADVGPRGMSARIRLSPGPTDTLQLVQIQGGASANTQFDLSFDDNIYATVFGDKMTTMTVTGVAFPDDVFCGGNPPDIIDYFQTYKARRDYITQVSIAFNNAVFTGVLVDMSVNPYNMQSVDAFGVTLVVYGRLAY